MPGKKQSKIWYILIFSWLGIFGWFRFSNELINDSFVYQQPISHQKEQSVASSAPVEIEVLAELTPVTSPVVKLGDKLIVQDVPFSSQAPFGEWSDTRQQDGCEEMAAIMTIHWVNSQPLTKEDAKKELFSLADWQMKKFKNYVDTSASDTVERIFKGYYNYDKIKVVYDIDAADIRKEILAGNIVIVPLSGRAIKNPYYTRDGPERHMLLIKGYDPATKEFITNDAGTRRGENYRYSETAVIKAVRDYPTGNHVPITETRRVMIVVYPK